MGTVRRYDLLQPIGLKSGARIDERTGFLHAKVRPTRTGILVYRLADGSISRELKHPEDVFDAASLATLERVVITRGHPRDSKGRPVDVTSSNVKVLQVGHGGSKIGRERVGDEEHPVVDATITDAAVVKDITEGKLDQVSMGYSVEVVDESGVWNGQAYDRRHKNIRYDHLAAALPMGGRGGSTVNVVLDSADGELVDDDADPPTTTQRKNEDDTMATIRFRIDDVEIELDPTALTVLRPALERRDAAIRKAEADAKAQADRITALEAERDQLKADGAKEKKRADDAEGAKGKGGAVKPVLVELARIRKLVPTIDEKQLDAMLGADDPIAALRKHAVLTVCADEADALKDKPAAYFDARLDHLLKDAKKTDDTAPIAGDLLRARPVPHASDEPSKKLDDILNLDGDPLAYVDDDKGLTGAPARPSARA